MPTSQLVLTRRSRIDELLEWARHRPSLVGVESAVHEEAMRKYQVSDMTARSYARVVFLTLKGEPSARLS